MDNNAVTIRGREKAALRNALVVILTGMALAIQSVAIPLHPFHRNSSLASLAGVPPTKKPARPNGLTAGQAITRAIAARLDETVAASQAAFTAEEAIAARRRVLVEINKRYSLHTLGGQDKNSLGRAQVVDWQADPTDAIDDATRRSEVATVWSLLDAATLYLDQRQYEEEDDQSPSVVRRAKQQLMLETASAYWRAAALATIASEAERLRRDIIEYGKSPRRETVSADVARIELSLEDHLEPLRQWNRSAKEAAIDLMECIGHQGEPLVLADFPEEFPGLPAVPHGDPSALQPAALLRRPELRSVQGKARVDEVQTRKVLLRFAPKATITLSRYDADPFPEWRNWMTVGTKTAWNIFTSTAYLPATSGSAPNPYGDGARLREFAKGAAVFAQVGIAYVDWKIEADIAASYVRRAETRLRLVDALAKEPSRKTTRAELLNHRIVLHQDRANALLALADARVAAIRLANAIGFDMDTDGRLLWKLDARSPVDLLNHAGDIPSALLAGGEPVRRALGEVDEGDILRAMAPSAGSDTGRTRVDLGRSVAPEIASINDWAVREQLAGRPFTIEEASAPLMTQTDIPSRPSASARPRPSAVPSEQEETMIPARLMQADDVRHRIVAKPQEPGRYHQPVQTPGGIPTPQVTDFVDPATKRIIETEAWRPVAEEEFKELAASGLTSPDSAAWNANAGMGTATQHESVSVTGVRLSPAPGGSLRPPSAPLPPVVQPQPAALRPQPMPAQQPALRPASVQTQSAPPRAQATGKVTETLAATATRESRRWDAETAAALEPLAPLQPLAGYPRPQPQVAPPQLQPLQWPDEPLDFLPAIREATGSR